MSGRQWLLVMIGWSLVIFGPEAGRAQAPPAGTCTISIEPTGGASVMVSALGCSGDMIGVAATAGGNIRQIPATAGPDFDLPVNFEACDFGLNHAAPVTYVATVLSGPDKGKVSQVTANLSPPSTYIDQPPSAYFESSPSADSWVRPGDSIHLTVNLEDDVGLSAIKVTDPTGAVLLDKKLTSEPQRDPCGPQRRYATVDVPVYVVPQNPPTPVIQFTAIVRDTAGHETSATTRFFTEPVWTGQMLLNGVGVHRSFNCTSSAHIELWVKVSTTNDVSGLARAQHGAVEGWTEAPGGCQRLPNSPGRFYYYSIKGTFDEKAKLFRLNFTLSPNSGGYDNGYIQSGLFLLDSANNWSTPWTIELPVLSSTHAQADHLSQTTAGDIGKNSTVSATGWAQLECCSTDAGPEVPTTAPKRPPIFLGEDNK